MDDLLIVCDKPVEVIMTLKDRYGFKIEGDGPLEYHISCDYILDPDGTLAAIPKKYIKKILDVYKNMFAGEEPKTYRTPLEKNDHPELDAKYISGMEAVTWTTASISPYSEPAPHSGFHILRCGFCLFIAEQKQSTDFAT